MRISTTILGTLTMIMGITAILFGTGCAIDLRILLIVTLITLAAVILLGVFLPTNKNASASVDSPNLEVESEKIG